MNRIRVLNLKYIILFLLISIIIFTISACQDKNGGNNDLFTGNDMNKVLEDNFNTFEYVASTINKNNTKSFNTYTSEGKHEIFTDVDSLKEDNELLEKVTYILEGLNFDNIQMSDEGTLIFEKEVPGGFVAIIYTTTSISSEKYTQKIDDNWYIYEAYGV